MMLSGIGKLVDDDDDGDEEKEEVDYVDDDDSNDLGCVCVRDETFFFAVAVEDDDDCNYVDECTVVGVAFLATGVVFVSWTLQW